MTPKTFPAHQNLILSKQQAFTPALSIKMIKTILLSPLNAEKSNYWNKTIPCVSDRGRFPQGTEPYTGLRKVPESNDVKSDSSPPSNWSWFHIKPIKADISPCLFFQQDKKIGHY